jgi:ribosomal protein L32
MNQTLDVFDVYIQPFTYNASRKKRAQWKLAIIRIFRRNNSKKYIVPHLTCDDLSQQLSLVNSGTYVKDSYWTIAPNDRFSLRTYELINMCTLNFVHDINLSCKDINIQLIGKRCNSIKEHLYNKAYMVNIDTIIRCSIEHLSWCFMVNSVTIYNYMTDAFHIVNEKIIGSYGIEESKLLTKYVTF